MYRNECNFSELDDFFWHVEEPGEVPTNVVKKINIIQILEFFQKCTSVGNDSFEILRLCKELL
jgi:hypothetical protein